MEMLEDEQKLNGQTLSDHVSVKSNHSLMRTVNELTYMLVLQLINISIDKKLLITCLQFLHNLVMHNEHRKLLLWLDLFGCSRPSDPYSYGNLQLRQNAEHSPVIVPEGISGEDGMTHRAPIGFPSIDDLNMALTALGTAGRSTGMFEPEDAARLASEVMRTVDGFVNMTLGQSMNPSVPTSSAQKALKNDHIISTTEDAVENNQPQKPPWNWVHLPDSVLYSDPRSVEIQEDDTKIGRTPQSAAETLREAKHQLMARLQDTSAFPLDGQENDGEEGNRNGLGQQEGDDVDIRGSDVAADGSVEEEEEDEEEGEEEEDDEYHGPGDQERGLLTDIPLVLQPQEIEALPMIIQAGIFTSHAPKNIKEAKEMQNMQAVRCNILLAQESGRNLLRELLIFIAAWDLQEDEFYFKLMMQIMEAILQNGLMPFAYQTFGEVKDIVSPAQSIVIKLLTQIFRRKQGLPPLTGAEGTAQLVFAPAPTPPGQVPRREPPTRVDLLVVRYIFTVFRQSIIPETCALIYLQGQIRAGMALSEDFPLNLWDMERVYEGVYQFLEFFAVLTESDVWKELLVKWEIVSELVTLLRELDASIPKAPLSSMAQSTTKSEVVAEGTNVSQVPAIAPVAIERPYDPISGDSTFPPHEYATTSAPESPSQGLDNQDPSEFEWRNLKKLVVLVLSSLVWKSVVVQNQIRQYGGVEMVLSCCNFDANNPYIREHAIMCLRFLLECNRDNQEIVEQLEARKTVPNEVLHKKDYETYIDETGKVGLRKMEGAVAVAQTQ